MKNIRWSVASDENVAIIREILAGYRGVYNQEFEMWQVPAANYVEFLEAVANRFPHGFYDRGRLILGSTEEESLALASEYYPNMPRRVVLEKLVNFTGWEWRLMLENHSRNMRLAFPA